ncbi:MAG: hypothetical protein AAF658_18325, partial [Myxococcota bacterium]
MGVGNLVHRYDALGRLTYYTYDTRHRLTGVDFDHDGITNSPDIAYGYDGWPAGFKFATSVAFTPSATAVNCGSYDFVFNPEHTAGRMAYADHSAGRTYYGYTPFGEVAWSIVERDSITSLCDLEVTGYTYDFAGRVTSIQYPSGRIVHYRYTTSGGTETLYAARIELEENDGQTSTTTTLVDDIVYAPGGRVRGYVAGEVTMSAEWDLAGQLERIHYTKTTGGESLFDWDITSRDGNGNILEVGDTVLGQNYSLKYDDRDRLRSSEGTNLKG